MTRAGDVPGNHLARMTRTRGFVLGVLAILVMLAAGSAAVAVSPSAEAATTSRQVLGVYAGAAYPPAVPAFTATLGTQPRFAMDFLDGSTWRTITKPRWPYSKWKGK